MRISLALVLLLITGSRSFSQTYIYTENFEGVTLPAIPAGWAEAHTGGGNGWVTNNGRVVWNSNDITPHTNYCMVDDAHHFWNNPAKLTTSTFSLVGAVNPYLSVDVMFNGMAACVGCPSEVAWIDISTNGGSSYTTIDTIHMLLTWRTLLISLSSVTPTANCKLRFCYADPGGYPIGLNGIAIDNIAVFAPATTDAGMTDIAPAAGHVSSFVKVGDSVYFQGNFNNYGTDSIAAAYTLNYQVGAATPVSLMYLVGPSGFGEKPFYLMTPYVVATPGPQTVKVWVSVPGDTNHANDTQTTVITGIAPASMPLKRFFIEELTGTWCGWCPRGIIYMDSVWKLNTGTVSISSVHSHITSDAMANDNPTTVAYDSFTLSIDAAGYPSCIVDRRFKDDVEWIDHDLHNLVNKDIFAFAAVGLTQTITGSTLTASATVKPVMDMTGDYRMELMVIEQDVTGYDQANAYSGSSTPLGIGCGYNFYDSAATIPAGHLQFPFVARYTIPGNLNTEPNGIAGSLPSFLQHDSVYHYTFPPVTIPSNWNPEKLSCIAMFMDNGLQSPNYGYVLNTASNTLTPAHLIKTEVPGLAYGPLLVQVFPNPAASEVNVGFTLAAASLVEISVYDMVGTKVLSMPLMQTSPGSHTVNISTGQLASGTYTIVVNTGTGKVSKKLSVMRQ